MTELTTIGRRCRPGNTRAPYAPHHYPHVPAPTRVRVTGTAFRCCHRDDVTHRQRQSPTSDGGDVAADADSGAGGRTVDLPHGVSTPAMWMAGWGAFDSAAHGSAARSMMLDRRWRRARRPRPRSRILIADNASARGPVYVVSGRMSPWVIQFLETTRPASGNPSTCSAPGGCSPSSWRRRHQKSQVNGLAASRNRPTPGQERS